MGTKAFYGNNNCFEKKKMVDECSEFDNIYCPRTCYYTKQREGAKRETIGYVYSNGALVRKILK